MGVLPTVLGIAGICVGWLPLVGFLGVLMGVVGCTIGVVSIVHWSEKSGNTGFGIAGLFLGSFAVAFGTAYQIKHGAGNMDMVYLNISLVPTIAIVACSIVISAVSLWAARKKPLLVWILVTYIAIITSMITVGSALVTADRANENVIGSNTKDMP